MSLTLTQLIGNTIMALIIGSVFYNLPEDTSSFYGRGALLFFAVLLNAFASALEVCPMPALCVLPTWILMLSTDLNFVCSTSDCRKTCSLCLVPSFCGSCRVHDL